LNDDEEEEEEEANDVACNLRNEQYAGVLCFKIRWMVFMVSLGCGGMANG